MQIYNLNSHGLTINVLPMTWSVKMAMVKQIEIFSDKPGEKTRQGIFDEYDDVLL